jgi:membrane protein DedA with SNARE-associated domain
MIFLQISYHLPIWPVILIGVAGSVAGRFILMLYIASVSGRIFKKTKNEQVQFLGEKLRSKGRKSQLFILLYSLLPIPTTPFFLAAGMAKLKPHFIIPPFFIGKLVSDSLAVLLGKYAAENATDLLHGALSWKSITSVSVGLLLIAAILFIDWNRLLRYKKLKLNFHIWK